MTHTATTWSPDDHLTMEPAETTGYGLVMRVRGGEHDGRVVRLHNRRCTIGGARSCTLRLANLDCSPVQCVLLRGQRGTVVRNWAPSTRLNGESFQDSWLVPGDRLEIGPLTLEVLSDQLSPADLQHPLLPGLGETSAWALNGRLQESRRLNRHRVGRLVRSLRRVMSRTGKLHEELRLEQSRVEDLRGQVAALEQRLALAGENEETITLLEQSLTDLRGQLLEQRQDRDRQQQIWVRHCRQVMQVLQVTQDELGADLNDAETCGSVVAELTERLASTPALREDTAAAQQELDERRQRLDEQFQQLLAQQQHLFQKEQQLDAQRAALEANWQQRQADLQRVQQADRDALTAARADWQAEQDRIQRELETQQRELQSARQQLAADRKSWEEQAAAASDAEERESELTTRLHDLHQELLRLKSDRSQAATQLELLESERLELLERAATLQDRLQSLQETLPPDGWEAEWQSKLASQETAWQETLERAAEQRAQLQQRVEQLEEELQRLREEQLALAGPQENHDDVVQQLAELTDRHQALTQQLAGLAAEREQLETALASQREETLNQQAAREQLVAEYEQRLTEAVRAAETLPQPTGDWCDRQELLDLLKERNQLQDQVETLQRRIEELEMEGEADLPPHGLPSHSWSAGQIGAEDPAADFADPAGLTPSAADTRPGFYGQSSADLMGMATMPLSALREELAAGAGWSTGAEQDPSMDPAEAPDASQYAPEPAPPQEVTYSPPAEYAPTDTAAILARFGAGYTAIDDDARGDESFGAADEQAAPAQASFHGDRATGYGESPARTAENQDEEGSIESYMAELMRRVGAGPVAPPAPPIALPSASTQTRHVERVAPQANRAPEGRGVEDDDVSPMEQLKAKAKPATIDLSAMRDVANQTARCDIYRHTNRRSMEDVYLKWGLAVVAAGIGGGLLTLAKDGSSSGLWGGAAALVVALLWGAQGANTWLAVKRQRVTDQAEADEEADA